MSSSSSTTPSQKEKKKRNRLRLSCTECTRRRQKCDRKNPCTLCVSRGVAHLCHWEDKPFSRPPPQRPPNYSVTEPTVQHLQDHIKSLEDELSKYRSLSQNTSPNTSEFTFMTSDSSGLSSELPSLTFNDFSPSNSELILPSPSNSVYSSPEPFSHDDDLNLPVSFSRLNQHVYDTVCTSSRSSVAHYGEYIGRGSALDALYMVSHSQDSGTRFLFARSADAITINPDFLQQTPPPPHANGIEYLFTNIPSAAALHLTSAFFADVNWRFGIPDMWFQGLFEQTLTIQLHYAYNRTQMNANWIALVYSVLALAPRNSIDPSLQLDKADVYLQYSLAALRIAENNYFKRSSFSGVDVAASGTVMGCLAVPLLCSYFSDRGRLSEAWKLAGNWLRIAESIGLHRDPDIQEYQAMPPDEKVLRRKAWWGLLTCERIYSFILGRSSVARQGSYDVRAGGFSRNSFDSYQFNLIQLTNIASDVIEKCFGLESPSSTIVTELDSKFEQWEAHLPAEYRLTRRSDPSPSRCDTIDTASANAVRQRYILNTYYNMFRMKLHLAYVVHKEPSSFLGVFPQTLSRRRSRSLCVSHAMDLIRLQCDVHDGIPQFGISPMLSFPTSFPGNQSLFERYWSLSDATTIILCVLRLQHPHDRPDDAENLVERSINTFNHMYHLNGANTILGQFAGSAISCIAPLMHEPGWQKTSTGITTSTFTPPTISTPLGESFDSSFRPFVPLSLTVPTYEWCENAPTPTSSSAPDPSYRIYSSSDNTTARNSYLLDPFDMSVKNESEDISHTAYGMPAHF